MNRRETERKNRIAGISTTLERMKEAGRELDKKKLVIEICREFGCSKRTASEYIDVAKSI